MKANRRKNMLAK